jgi:hypothetical protein
MTRPETNEIHKEPDRDPRGFCVGVVGILLIATWTCLVLIEKRHPPKGGFTAVSNQAKYDGATSLVALMSEFLVSAVEAARATLGLNEVFVGVIVIAVIGNAPEHSTAS